MKAILVNEPGDVEKLFIGDFPTPSPTDVELLVKVKATSLNRVDLLQRMGKYPPPQGVIPILGLDLAGVVEKVRSDSNLWKKGDRVFGLIPGGGYAEYAVIHEKMAMPIPENLSFEEAAAIPEVFLTAYQTLFWLGDLNEKESVLIHAGASGVGTAAIQLVREGGANSIVTASSEEKLTACRKLGAKVTINYKEGPFAPRVLEVTEERGVDLILDFVGAPYFEENLISLAEEGRLILIGTLGGRMVKDLDLSQLMRKKIKVIGTTMRGRSQEYKIRLTREFSLFALPRFRDGRIKPVIHQILPWNQVREAHQIMEENLNIGKIVLKI